MALRTEELMLNMGPQHPSTHGVLRLVVTLDGEMMRGRHTAAILDLMNFRDTTARTIDEYVSIAGSLGRNGARRGELSARIAEKKQRVYRDRDCIVALEAFLDRAVRKNGVDLCEV